MLFCSYQVTIVMCSLILFHLNVGGYEIMALLNESWHFASASLYGLLLVSDVTLSI